MEENNALILGVCSWVADKWGGNIDLIRWVVVILILVSGILPGLAIYVVARAIISLADEDKDYNDPSND